MIRIVPVYQSLLGIYGDRGNSTVLLQRLLRRGIEAEVSHAEPGGGLPHDGDIYVMGGGEDLAQTSALAALRADNTLQHAIADGAVLFAVCAGFQICGRSVTGLDGTRHEGLGLFDATTTPGPQRAVGEIVTTWQMPSGVSYSLTGFENHGGYTTLGPDARALGIVTRGVGNNGDGSEGAVQGRCFGTYLHGPCLMRNPALADHLLELAVGHELEPLDLPEVEQLRAERIGAARR